MQKKVIWKRPNSCSVRASLEQNHGQSPISNSWLPCPRFPRKQSVNYVFMGSTSPRMRDRRVKQKRVRVSSKGSITEGTITGDCSATWDILKEAYTQHLIRKVFMGERRWVHPLAPLCLRFLLGKAHPLGDNSLALTYGLPCWYLQSGLKEARAQRFRAQVQRSH